MALHLGRTRVLLFAKFGNTIPVPFLVLLVFRGRLGPESAATIMRLD